MTTTAPVVPVVHVGLHHYAPCGTWRPVPGNHECGPCHGPCTCQRPTEPRPSSWGGGSRDVVDD